MTHEDSIFEPLPEAKNYALYDCSEHDNKTENIISFVKEALPTFTNRLKNIHVYCTDCGFGAGYQKDGQYYENTLVGGKAWKKAIKDLDQKLIDEGIISGADDDL